MEICYHVTDRSLIEVRELLKSDKIKDNLELARITLKAKSPSAPLLE